MNINNPSTVSSKLKKRPNSYSTIPINKLIPFSKHPFKLYEGQRLSDMVESIKANGIISPPIVRLIPDTSNFEILSGHNRVNSAKLAGYTEIFCVAVGGLSEDEALLWVTQSNLMQRSFGDLTHSEKAAVVSADYEATKRQGKRSDLIKEIENLLLNPDKAHEIKEISTSPQLGEKLGTDRIIGEKYGLGKSDVARYIRLNRLIDPFKTMLDINSIGGLSVGAGYDLTFLSETQQKELYSYITEDLGDEIQISMLHAKLLKQLALDGKLNIITIDKVFQGKVGEPKKPKVTIRIKYKRKDLKMQYPHLFSGDETDEDINNTLSQALEFYNYHKYNNKTQGSVVSVPIEVTSVEVTPKTATSENKSEVKLNQAQSNNIKSAMLGFSSGFKS